MDPLTLSSLCSLVKILRLVKRLRTISTVRSGIASPNLCLRECVMVSFVTTFVLESARICNTNGSRIAQIITISVDVDSEYCQTG